MCAGVRCMSKDVLYLPRDTLGEAGCHKASLLRFSSCAPSGVHFGMSGDTLVMSMTHISTIQMHYSARSTLTNI